MQIKTGGRDDRPELSNVTPAVSFLTSPARFCQSPEIRPRTSKFHNQSNYEELIFIAKPSDEAARNWQ
jgi:hypothetical protein